MPVCIAGMHRSGTSMVANLLRLCGLCLGPEPGMIPPGPDNPAGFWESLKFRDLNDEILRALNGTYDAPPRPPAGWHESEAVAPLREKAEAALRELASAGGEWGWKDPRNSLTLPFWRSLRPDIRVVVCVRDPRHVALSERKRWERLYALNRPALASLPLYLATWKLYDGLAGSLSIRPRAVPSNRQCYDLWLTYNEAVMNSTRPSERIVTHYDKYFAEPEAELRRVLTFLRMEATDEHVAAACAAVSGGMRHNRSADRGRTAARQPRAVAELYARLSVEAGHAAGLLS